MKPVVVADYKNIVGEGPLWHPKKNILFWIDIMAGRIFTLDPSTGDHSLFHQGGILGGFTFQADDSLLLFIVKISVSILISCFNKTLDTYITHFLTQYLSSS